jgi:hypothetical protein
MARRSSCCEQSGLLVISCVSMPTLSRPSSHSLEENGIVTRCDITTFDSVEVSDLPYDDEARVQKLILNVSPNRYSHTAHVLALMPPI